MIQFEHVNKSYGKNPVLKDLNFTIQDGQFVVLIGPSGCGKTTTMKMINRLLEPDSGTISIDGQDIHKQDKVELRRHIGYVIQQIGLFPNMTVAQNICVVPKLLKYDKARCDEIVREMLRMVPESGSSRRLIIFMVVVLPQPEGPIRTTNCPSGMVKFRSLRTGVLP